MDDLIQFTQLNDFIFCPISIFYHGLYSDTALELYQSEDQLNGTAAHSAIDNGTYSSKKSILKGIEVISTRYGLVGKIDIYDAETKTLSERKKRIKQIYDGYVFQLYAQYFAMIEMGYDVKRLVLHSMDDNKSYNVVLPQSDSLMFTKFTETINSLKTMDISLFSQENKEKCSHCIYEPACGRSSI